MSQHYISASDCVQRVALKKWLQQELKEDKFANYEDWGGLEAKAVYFRLLRKLEAKKNGK